MRRLLAILIAALGWCAAAEADPAADAERYAACMERARAAPEAGLAEAEAWLTQTESTAARHCRAVALVGLGRAEEAVGAFEELGRAQEKPKPALAAELYRQAAMVELEAGRLDAAEALQDRGLGLAPDSVELLIDRALLLGAREDYAEALKTLERARQLAPARADVLVLTAAAHRLLGRPEPAQQALEAALALDPDDAGALRAGRANIHGHLDYVGWLTMRRNWLAGDRFSLADIAAAAHLSAVDYVGDVPWSEHEDAKLWYQRVKSRPSFRPLLADILPGAPPPRHYADLDF